MELEGSIAMGMMAQELPATAMVLAVFTAIKE
jgi:hypothetical protein